MRPRAQARAPPRSAAWRAARTQGHVLPRRQGLHRRKQDPAGPGADDHRDRAAAARRGGRDRDRRPQHVGVRRRSDRAQHPFRALPQRVQRGAHPGRLVERLGGCGCGARRVRRARLRHRRLDPAARGLQRRHRPQADLWAREPPRRDAALVEHGSCRAVRTHRARLCAAAASHCRTRSERRHVERAARSGLSARPRRRAALAA